MTTKKAQVDIDQVLADCHAAICGRHIEGLPSRIREARAWHKNLLQMSKLDHVEERNTALQAMYDRDCLKVENAKLRAALEELESH